MANFFRFRCPSVNCLAFIASFLISLVVSRIILSTIFMHSHFDRIAESVEAEKFLHDVYHSGEVFRMNYAEMEKKFKIYVYSDGDEFTNYDTTIGKYASEGYFFKNIRESSFLTDDPDQAHLFFIPISFQKIHQKVSSYEEMASIVEKYVEGLILKYPYWNKTLGADHFFLTCHDTDVGATLDPMLVKNSIRVVCSSTYSAVGFIPHKDVSLPSVLQPFSRPAGGNDIDERKTLGYWAGVCNSDTRKTLLNLWGADDELDIQNTTVYVAGRMKKLYSAKFCICPVGSRITNSRITMAIHYGCVPVILEDYFELPFNDVLNWGKFSVILNEGDVYRLKDILKAKEGADYRMLYSYLIKVQRHFQWNTPPVKYDAFHMIMYDLWLRRQVVKY